MAAIYWPETLPQVPQKGFTESGGMNILRSQTDMGPAKQRPRGRSPDLLNLSFIMTTAQTETFEDFVKNDLRGVNVFKFTHPRKDVLVDVRLVPPSAGQSYQFQYLAPGYWTVTLQFEVLP